MNSAQKRQRDREIHRLRDQEKVSVAELAKRYDLSEQRIEQILTRERYALYNLPAPEKRADLTADLEELRELVMEVARMEGAPITATSKDGLEYVRDPETGAFARDYAGRLNAAAAVTRIAERLAKLHGVDAPQEVLTEQHVTYEIKGVSEDDL